MVREEHCGMGRQVYPVAKEGIAGGELMCLMCGASVCISMLTYCLSTKVICRYRFALFSHCLVGFVYWRLLIAETCECASLVILQKIFRSVPAEVGYCFPSFSKSLEKLQAFVGK